MREAQMEDNGWASPKLGDYGSPCFPFEPPLIQLLFDANYYYATWSRRWDVTRADFPSNGVMYRHGYIDETTRNGDD